MGFLNNFYNLKRQFYAISRPLAFILLGFGFILCIGALSVSDAFGAGTESDYSRIEMIHRRIEKDSGDINVYATTLKLRDAFFHLLYGSGDDFSSQTVMYYSELIARNALKNKIDPMLILAVIATESSFRKDAVSPVGALGLMQLMPSTARYISAKTGEPEISGWRQLFVPHINISLGTAYLAYLVKLTGSVRQGLIAYNIGPTNLFNDIRRGYRLPMEYVYNVMDKYNEIKSFENRSMF